MTWAIGCSMAMIRVKTTQGPTSRTSGQAAGVRLESQPPGTIEHTLHPSHTETSQLASHMDSQEVIMSPIIDIHPPSPSIKKTQRETNFLSGSCRSKIIHLQSLTLRRMLATHHCDDFEVEVVAGSVTF